MSRFRIVYPKDGQDSYQASTAPTLNSKQTKFHVYEIRDLEGKIVAYHERVDYSDGTKTAKWRGPRGRNHLDQKVTELPLYRTESLPSVTTDSVVLCEGEKATDALASLRVPALGTVTGAKTIPNLEVLGVLKPFLCYLWPDNDADGQLHMTKIARKLTQMGVTCYWVNWKEAPHKGDAFDFVQQGADRDKVIDLLSQAKEWAEEKYVKVDWRELLEQGLPPVEFLLDSLIYKGKAHMLHGESGDGKTLLTLALCATLVKKGQNVVYIDEENPLEVIVTRLVGLGLGVDELESHFHYYHGLEPQLKDAPDLEWAVLQNDPCLVVYDSGADFYVAAQLDENDNTRMVQWAQKFLLNLPRKHGVSTWLLEHENRSHDSAQARGAGAKKQKVDVAFHLQVLTRFSESQIGKVEFKLTKDRVGRMPVKRTMKIGGDGVGNIVFQLLDEQELEKQKLRELKAKKMYWYGQIEKVLKDLGAVSLPTAISQSKLLDHLPTGLDVYKKREWSKECADNLLTKVKRGMGPRQAVVFWVEK